MRIPKKYTAVLFDLDGTLVSNYTAIHHCLCACFEKFGVPKPDYDLVVRTVGGSILITIRKLLAYHNKEHLADEIGNMYIPLFPKYIFDGLAPMPYAEDFLRALKSRGLKLACFTNKQQDGAEKILQHLGLDKYLDAIIGTTLHSPRKPEKEFTDFALKTLGVSADETIGIGDSPYDYKAARVCGIDSALVATGGDSLEFLSAECPDRIGVFADFKDMACEIFDIEL